MLPENDTIPLFLNCLPLICLPFTSTQEIWSQVSGMTKKGGAGSDRKAIVVQKMAYFTATIEQPSAKASTSVVMLPTQLRQTSLCLLQANYRSRNIFLPYLPSPSPGCARWITSHNHSY